MAKYDRAMSRSAALRIDGKVSGVLGQDFYEETYLAHSRRTTTAGIVTT